MLCARNVLEWRLDPTSPDSIPEARDPNFQPVLFCNDSYSSSLAADSLRQIGEDGPLFADQLFADVQLGLLGVKQAGDLAGGFREWKRAGLPVDEKKQSKE